MLNGNLAAKQSVVEHSIQGEKALIVLKFIQDVLYYDTLFFIDTFYPMDFPAYPMNTDTAGARFI